MLEPEDWDHNAGGGHHRASLAHEEVAGVGLASDTQIGTLRVQTDGGSSEVHALKQDGSQLNLKY